jgi:hypothetical protein
MDALNTLMLAIINHFVGDPSKYNVQDRLEHIRCPTLTDFR